jgi:hypothetical protein
MPDEDHRTVDRPPADLAPASPGDTPVLPADRIGRGMSGVRRLGLIALPLMAGLALGVAQHYVQHREVAAAAEQQRDFVPRVRVAAV